MKIYIHGHKDFDLHFYNPNIYEKCVVNIPRTGENIDTLHKILCEYCTMYYVWKNKLKDDVVAFCHYSRQLNFEDIDTNKILQENSFQGFYLMKSNHANCGHLDYKSDYFGIYVYLKYTINAPLFLYNDIKEYLNNQSFIDPILLRDNSNINRNISYTRCIFATTWDMFCSLMEFLNGFIEFTKSKYNLDKSIDWIIYFRNNIISHYRQWNGYDISLSHRMWQNPRIYNTIFDSDYGWFGGSNAWRVYAYIIEYLINIYMKSTNVFFEKIYENRDFR